MSVSVDIQKPQGSTPTAYYDVVILGAGPYGLSTAAHLAEKGLNIAVFGKPMQLWRENMPEGMMLRSYWWATNLSDAHKQYSFARFFQERDMVAPHLLPRETFIDYGLWFQQRAVPNVDETFVSSITHTQDQFELELEDGRKVRSRTLILAPGLHYYVYRPVEYDHLPHELVTHAAEHVSFGRFAGKRVVIIGGGQSALESAALLNESGADVEVVSRHPIHWLTGEAVDNRTLFQRIRFPKAGISPGWFNWGLENIPYGFQHLPRSAKDGLLRGRGRYGPAGSYWLKPRIIDKVALCEGQRVQEMKEVDNGVQIMLEDGHVMRADHVLLSTGYRVNIWKLPMLHETLVSRIKTYHNAPILNNRFEANIPGLYFVGISSVLSAGPLYRFVVGTDATARRVAMVVSKYVAQIK